MLFTLEALQARHGDALLLHYGRPDRPRLIVIDGGPSGVYRNALEPRLLALRDIRTPDESLPIRLLMVSHIDDDHIKGILELTANMIERESVGDPPLWTIRSFWHNSFDDIVGNSADELFRAAEAEVGAAGFGEDVPPNLPVSHEAALMLANVPQGRTLRSDAKKLGLELNHASGGLILAAEKGEDEVSVSLGDGLSFHVLGPLRREVEELQKEWDKELKKRGLAEPAQAASYVDKSVFNLSSIVVLAEAGGRRMLLTGDARGDHTLEAIEAAGLFEDGRLHVDLLKLPHHGSHHNVDLDYFQKITADHYVISGDGKYGNPEMDTFRLISKARGNDEFVIHLTYRPEELKSERPGDEVVAFFKAEKKKGKQYEVRYRDKDAESVLVDLGDDPYEGQ